MYLEIGVRDGDTLALASGPCVGVDPAPTPVALARGLPLVVATSDEFFDTFQLASPVDMAFIDGMHLWEYALRDFIGVESMAAEGAVAVFDDVLPANRVQALRGRRTRAWTGDVWRVVEVLRRWRPDLDLQLWNTSPTGLLVVSGLRRSRAYYLASKYDEVMEFGFSLQGPPAQVLQRDLAVDTFW